MPTAAYAQSTGSIDFEKDTIVVTGTRQRDVGGIQAPDASKAKSVVTQEMIARSGPGQSSIAWNLAKNPPLLQSSAAVSTSKRAVRSEGAPG